MFILYSPSPSTKFKGW